MKKIFFPLCLFAAMQGHSQFIRSELAIKENETHLNEWLKKNNLFISGFTNDINTNVYKTFIDMFGSVPGVYWFIEKMEITSYFILDSISVIGRYKKNGNLISIRKNYDASKLNLEITDFLKQELGTSFSVNLVTEILREDDTIYEISLQDKKRLCIVQLYKNKENEKLRIIDKKFLTKC